MNAKEIKIESRTQYSPKKASQSKSREGHDRELHKISAKKPNVRSKRSAESQPRQRITSLADYYILCILAFFCFL
ncbi:hypothetical protein L596_006279 [Steinernema carpocapsae]|uniref:Uncharacterized protein n=1 Tax=Steinernema carpocapsae TaxID=34508 RepID=A0A4U8V1K8_STECR|nr:hypothetical protein L596_006279 [Steinernema carpocapsae]